MREWNIPEWASYCVRWRLKVVFSTEEPAKIPPERYALCPGESKGTAGRPVPASVSFVPPVAGFILAGEVIKDLTEGFR